MSIFTPVNFLSKFQVNLRIAKLKSVHISSQTKFKPFCFNRNHNSFPSSTYVIFIKSKRVSWVLLQFRKVEDVWVYEPPPTRTKNINSSELLTTVEPVFLRFFHSFRTHDTLDFFLICDAAFREWSTLSIECNHKISQSKEKLEQSHFYS